MARNFAGADYIITGIGGLVGIGSSGHTLFAICRRAANGAWHTPISIETSANSSKLAMQFSDTDKIQLIIGSSNKDTTVGISSADNWVLAAVTRASGSSVPRGHKYVYDTNTWTHTDAGAASGGDSTDLTGGRVQLGRWQTTDFFNGDIHLGGALKRALTDGELESLPYTLLAAAAAAPDGLWLLDQHATTQTVIDLTGNGANQTSLTGTSVATTSTPLWSYGLGASIAIGKTGGGGPTQYTQTNTGSLTPAGALVRQTAKLPAGTVTPTGALARSTAKTVAGTATPAGALVRQAAKSFAGSLTPAGALATLKAALRSFAGSLTPTGALTRQTNKVVAGAVTPTGTIQRSTAKLFAGAIAGVGAVVKQTAKRFVGALAPTGAVTNTQLAAEAKATSAATVTAVDTSTSQVTAGRTSTSAVTARATSSGGVV
jgi:hypothetical protein